MTWRVYYHDPNLVVWFTLKSFDTRQEAKEFVEFHVWKGLGEGRKTVWLNLRKSHLERFLKKIRSKKKEYYICEDSYGTMQVWYPAEEETALQYYSLKKRHKRLY